jgi:hypothetical protein
MKHRTYEMVVLGVDRRFDQVMLGFLLGDIGTYRCLVVTMMCCCYCTKDQSISTVSDNCVQ